ncbi:MAG: response regulator transcription factor [Lentisphaerae bacterium]|jgi:two-component system, OmpR family, response regulator|nr:response regulator transcription factor [Lentisphaerota bacterium]MBT4815431.1 response regulator transcription factor [Lentisphaerota bacterium]MBT5605089.1 response regulator transcription factor [Lentisphaerota bacterium]MBT7062226.1 response regulator transcription factor [Lentisphaerota bacterium]MBT7847052.1 response regulator transcription factor [Lentisphaerota bacterium]
MNLLVIEDDSLTASFVVKGFREAGFTTEHAADGLAGLRMAAAGTFDVAVVDIMLPGMDGLALISELRGRGVQTPVLILSAKGSVDDRVKGLHVGGDDYLVKPFAFSELLARVQALIRRATATAEPTTLSVRDLTIDLLRRRATRAGVAIDLQPREFALLEFLARNAGRVVSKTMIMEHVWEYNFDPQTNVVEARVCRLRDKVDRPFADKLIHTVRGVGYVLE